jgi:hypothetical protein
MDMGVAVVRAKKDSARNDRGDPRKAAKIAAARAVEATPDADLAVKAVPEARGGDVRAARAVKVRVPDKGDVVAPADVPAVRAVLPVAVADAQAAAAQRDAAVPVVEVKADLAVVARNVEAADVTMPIHLLEN